MNEPTTQRFNLPLEEILERLQRLQDLDDILPGEDSPLGQTTKEFFINSWVNARDGLLTKTPKMRVYPTSSGPAPRVFRFELETSYKSKRSRDSEVELVEGHLRGTIRYRADIFLADPNEPSVGVFLDPDQHFFHPNFSRSHGILCLGDAPSGPYELADLLEDLYWILTYQNRNSSDPADPEAARYFALHPDAMKGLEDVSPLY